MFFVNEYFRCTCFLIGSRERWIVMLFVFFEREEVGWVWVFDGSGRIDERGGGSSFGIFKVSLWVDSVFF